MKFRPLSLTPRDEEFIRIQSRIMSRIISIFGIPPSLLRETKKVKMGDENRLVGPKRDIIYIEDDEGNIVKLVGGKIVKEKR